MPRNKKTKKQIVTKEQLNAFVFKLTAFWVVGVLTGGAISLAANQPNTPVKWFLVSSLSLMALIRLAVDVNQRS